ncbi:MAG TPA: OsmC family protein [Thermoanaerobaculia bacterium]|nr:OsmC family protein [Thermoanaerobaculia bacterium]
MPTRRAEAEWTGDLKGGQGTMALGSGAYRGGYSFGSRFEEAPGTNPEELIGAALAGCYSMALAAGLGKDGHHPERVATRAKVTVDKVEGGFAITRIELSTEARVPGLDDATFQKAAEATKRGCPVGKALGGTEITVDAKLLS